MNFSDEMLALGPYLDAFCNKAPGMALGTLGAQQSLVIPSASAAAGHSFPLKLVQAFLNSKGFKGKNGKVLAVDDAWGTNTQFALEAFDAALAKQRGGGPRLAKVWSRIAATNNVEFEPAVGNMLRAWLRLDAGAKRIAAEPKVKARLPSDLVPTATAAKNGGGPGPEGTQPEKSGSLNQIARAFGIDIKVDTPYGADTRDAWLFLSRTFGLNGKTFPVEQDRWGVYVDPDTFATLRVKSRSAKSSPTSMAQVRAALAGKSPAKKAAAPRQPVTRPTAASKPGMQKVSVGAVQDILLSLKVGIGAAGRDGLWGSNTQNGWVSAAGARGLDPTINRAAPNEAWVMPATFAALAAAAAAPKKIVGEPEAPVEPPAPAPAPGEPAGNMTAPLSVADIQLSILIPLGWSKKGRDDGKWGPKTQAAWADSAKRRGLDPWTMSKTGAQTVIVRPATYAKLSADAAKKAAPVPAPKKKTPAPSGKPTAPSKTGLQKVTVGAVQDILLALKVSVGKSGRDGEWGPDTQKGWVSAAAKRKLDPTIDRAGPNDAWVAPETFRKLGVEAGLVKPEPKPSKEEPVPPAPAPGPAPKPAAPAPDKPADVVVVEPSQIGNVFRNCAVAIPGNVDGFKAAWAKLTAQENAPGAKRVPGDAYLQPVKGGVEVSKTTFDLLSDRCTKRAASRELIAMATVTVPVKLLQQALQQFKEFGKLKVTGTWNIATETGFIKYIVNQPKAVQIWEKALPRLLGSEKKSVRVTPAQAELIGKLAKQQQQRKKAKKQSAKLLNFLDATKPALLALLNDTDLLDAVIPAAATFAQLKPIYAQMVLAQSKSANTEMLPGEKPGTVRVHKDSVKLLEAAGKGAVPAFIAPVLQRSTVRVSALLIGQAMSRVRELQQEGKASGLGPGGTLPAWKSAAQFARQWQAPYTSFLERAVGTMLYPDPKQQAVLTDKIFATTIESLRSKAAGPKEVVGGGDYIMLPPDAAKTLEGYASEYVAAQGGQVEPVLDVPIPSQPGKVQGEPVLITGRVDGPPEQPLVTPTPVPQGQNIQVPVIQTPEGPRSDITTGATQTGPTTAAGGAVGPTTAGGAQVGPTQAGGAQVGPQTAGGAQVTGPSITGPSINIQIPSAAPAPAPALPVPVEPAPIAPIQASAGGSGLAVGIGVAVAGLLGYMIFSGASGAAKEQGA